METQLTAAMDSLAIAKDSEPAKITCTFLDLPGELRNRVYAYCLFTGPASRALLKFEGEEKDIYTLKPEYVGGIFGCKNKAWFKQPYINVRNRQPRGPFALLYTNPQIRSEFIGALMEHTTYYMRIGLHVVADGDGSNATLPWAEIASFLPLDSKEGPPVQATRLALVLDCPVRVRPGTTHKQEPRGDDYVEEKVVHPPSSTEHYGPWVPLNEDAINTSIIASKEFEELGHRLQACKKTEEIIIQWILSPLDHNRLLTSYRDRNSSHTVFEGLIKILESMPNLRRYSVHAGACAMYAHRWKGDDWNSNQVIRRWAIDYWPNVEKEKKEVKVEKLDGNRPYQDMDSWKYELEWANFQYHDFKMLRWSQFDPWRE